MKKIIYLLVFCLTGTLTMAQNSAINKAANYEKQGKLEEAKEQIDLAVVNDKTKDNAKAWHTKGVIYGKMAMAGNADALPEAISALKKAMSLDSKYEIFSGQEIEGLWSGLIGKAIESYNAEDLPTAADIFGQAASIKPLDTLAHLNKGIAAQQSGDMETAMESFYALIKCDPEYSENSFIYTSLASMEYNKNDNPEKALEVIEEGLERYPDCKDCLAQKVSILIATDQLDAALAPLKEATTKDPGNSVLWLQLGNIYDQTGDYDLAVGAYEKAVEAAPDDYSSLFNLGVAHYNKGAGILKEVNDMDYATFQKSGEALQANSMQYFEKAKPYFQKARTLQPDDQDAADILKEIERLLATK